MPLAGHPEPWHNHTNPGPCPPDCPGLTRIRIVPDRESGLTYEMIEPDGTVFAKRTPHPARVDAITVEVPFGTDVTLHCDYEPTPDVHTLAARLGIGQPIPEP